MPHSITLDGLDRDPGAAQSAIDACPAGGGEVIVPPGRWDLGELRLRSGVRLRLAAGCALAGPVLAENVEDVAIVGEDPGRARLEGGVRLRHVRGVECRDYSGRLTSGVHVSDGRFSGLVLHQPPQRQGEGSVVCFRWVRNLHFSDCDLESNDDVFCLKRAAENVTLTRSRLCGRMAASWKIGTETDGPFRHIRFTDSVVENADRAAISIESVDGSSVEDVLVERIEMRDVDVPLFIRLGNRDRYAAGPGSIRNIVIRDVRGYGDAFDEGYGSCISGLPGRCVEDVLLADIAFTSRGGQAAELARRRVPERPELYPEFDMFGRLPAHGLYARHVRGLRLERVSFRTALPDGRPEIAFEDVEDAACVDCAEPAVRPYAAPPPKWAELPERDPRMLVEAIAAAEPGGTVEVAPGEYRVPRSMLPIVIEREGLTLRSAEGPERTRIVAVGAREDDAQHRTMVPPEAAMRGDPLFFVTADRVRIAGLTLSAAVYNVYLGEANDCAIEENIFDFSKCHQVYAFRCRRLRLARNTTRATLNCALKLDACEACEVVGNTLREDPAGVRLDGSCRCRIAGNRFLALSWDGVRLAEGSHENRIEGNRFTDGRLTGMQIRTSDRNEVIGNEFRGHKTESVLVDRDATGNRLRNNSFHDNRGLAVSNETPHPVDARENWWGSPEGPGPGAEVDRNVLVEPWLRAPPEAVEF